jgi:ACT domain-containing protein
MHRDKDMAINDICKTLGISRSTFYRYIALSEQVASQESGHLNGAG